MESNYPPLSLTKTSFLIKGIYELGDYEQNREEQCRLFVDGQEVSLADSLKIRNHSPGGFNWGYSGSGPAQSALALCLHIFQNPYVAEALYQSFKETFVARWQPQLTSFERTIDLADFLIDNRETLKQVLEQQTWAEEAAGWALVAEADQLVNPTEEFEPYQPEKPAPENHYQVLDVVRTRVTFLDVPAGSRAFVYELYAGGGISIFTETGKDLGGFSLDEQPRYLDFLYHAAGFDYDFRSIHQLHRDWEQGLFLGVFR